MTFESSDSRHEWPFQRPNFSFISHEWLIGRPTFSTFLSDFHPHLVRKSSLHTFPPFANWRKNRREKCHVEINAFHKFLGQQVKQTLFCPPWICQEKPKFTALFVIIQDCEMSRWSRGRDRHFFAFSVFLIYFAAPWSLMRLAMTHMICIYCQFSVRPRILEKTIALSLPCVYGSNIFPFQYAFYQTIAEW